MEQKDFEICGVPNRGLLQDTVFIVITFVGLVMYYCGFVNMYIWILLLLIYLATCNRVESGFFSLLFGSSLFGRMFASQQLYIFTIIVSLLLGMVLLYKEIIKAVNYNIRPYFFMIVILVTFVIYFLLGSSTNYAKEKIVKLIVRGLIWITAFMIFSQSEKISNKKLSICFLILSLFYISQSYQMYGVKPHSLWDFGFFRDFCDIIGRNANRTLVVN